MRETLEAILGRMAENKRRPLTIWELAEEYPKLVREVVSNREQPLRSYVLLDLPQGGDVLGAVRRIPGSRWQRREKAWAVPAYSSLALHRLLDMVATRSK